jgi:hypothetical protein
MPLRLAQATNAEAIWGEMEAEYHTFLNDPKEGWKRSEFQFKRPSPKQLGQFAPLAALKVWIHFASGDHYFVYLIGKSSSGSGRDIKVLAGNLIRSAGG